MENLIRISDILECTASSRDGKSEYDIESVILSRNGNLSGIIISKKGLFGLKRYASAKNIDKLRLDGIIIKDTEKFSPKRIKNMSYASAALLKKNVISVSGIFMGHVSDFYIHTDKMQVMAVEVARSFFEDLFTGRIIIPGNIIAGTDNAIQITEIQLENTLHNTKGIINAIDDGLKSSEE